MRRWLWGVLLLYGGAVFSSVISVEERNNPLISKEVETLGRLIVVTEKRLEEYRKLRDKMSSLEQQKEEFLLGNESSSHAFSLVHNARDILASIKESHLAYLFPGDYLEELVFFSSLATKQAPVRPSP